jgi:hypothetical protein
MDAANVEAAPAVFGGLFCAFVIIGLALTAFWIWMLVDCISNEPSTGNDKVIWVLVIVLAGWIGALIYFVVRRPKRPADTA